MIKTAVLVIGFAWGGYLEKTYEVAFPTMEECNKQLRLTEVQLPQGAADNEYMVFKLCKYGIPKRL